MILIIDNYDSFTFNLYQLIGEINPDIKVVRNDKITIDEISSLQPSHIIISPARAIHSRQAFAWRLSASLQASSLFWVSAWVIRRLVKPLAVRWCTHRKSCTARATGCI